MLNFLKNLIFNHFMTVIDIFIKNLIHHINSVIIQDMK